MKIISLCAASLLALSSHAYAQSDPATGTLSVRAIENDALREGAIFGDFTLATTASPIRFQLGWFGVIGRLHESYADVSYLLPQGEVSAGFPRPAYDSFVQSALTTSMPRFALETIGQTRGRGTVGTMTQADYLPYGARYTRASGTVSSAVSLHAVPDYQTEILGAGAAWTRGAWQYSGAFELVSQDGAFDTNIKAGLAFLARDWSVGVQVHRPQANGFDTMLEVSGHRRVVSNFDVTGMMRLSQDADPVMMVASSYEVSQNYLIELGLGYQADQTTLELGASYRF